MTSKQSIRLLLAISVICLIAFAGCSENSFSTQSTYTSPDASPVTYIPMEQGLRINYVDLEPELNYYDIEITNPVIIAGNAGFTFRRTDRETNETVSWYEYNKGNAIFHSKTTLDPGYKILQAPFVAGTTWDIYDTSTSSSGDGAGGNGNGENEVGKGNDAGGLTIFGQTWKIIPGGDFTTMTIVGFETVEAMNGNRYGNCLKVQWQTDSLSSNYYWYAAGIGMIKFERTSESVYQSGNNILSVMSDFQSIEY